MRPDPRFTVWLSRQAPPHAPHDLLEQSMREIGATLQSPMHRFRRLFAGLSVAMVATAAVAIAFVASRQSPIVGPAPSGPAASQRGTPEPTTTPSRSAVTRQAARVVARIPLPNADPQTAFVNQIAVTDGAIWTAGLDGQELVQIDSRQDRVVSDRTLEQPSELVVSDSGELWTLGPVGVAPGPPNLDVGRVDPATGLPRSVTEVPQTAALAVGFGRIWVAEFGAGLAVRDAATGARLRTFRGVDAIGLTVGCGSVWAWRLGDEPGWELDRIEPNSGIVLEHFLLPDGVKQRLVEIGGTCWTDDGVNVYGVTPGEPLIETAIEPAGRVHLTNDSAWVLEGNLVRRVDLLTGRANGPTWELPESDVRIEVPKVGADWHLLSADGSLWLLRNDELIRYAIPTR